MLILSYASSQPLTAVNTKSCVSRGSDRSGADWGSISSRMILARVLFADPCSP